MKIKIKALRNIIRETIEEMQHEPVMDEEMDSVGTDAGMEVVDEVAPPGGEKVVKALKKEKGVKNPWAVAWSMKNKGAHFKK